MIHAMAGSPFDGLDIRGDWELTIQIDVDRQDYRDKPWSAFTESYGIEAGSKNGRWRLRVAPITGYDDETGLQQGPLLVELRDQTTRPTPLEWLVGLISGGMG